MMKEIIEAVEKCIGGKIAIYKTEENGFYFDIKGSKKYGSFYYPSSYENKIVINTYNGNDQGDFRGYVDYPKN